MASALSRANIICTSMYDLGSSLLGRKDSLDRPIPGVRLRSPFQGGARPGEHWEGRGGYH